MIKLYVCEITNLIEEVKTDSKALENYFDTLGKARVEHILKSNRAEDRARSLAAALLLLFALRQEEILLEKLPDFSYEGKDKPYLKEVPGLYFNLSHTQNMVVCAISEKEVGVDIEHVREIKETTIQRVFSEKEKQFAKNTEDGFVRLWTMKEACAKLRGIGLADILEGMEIIREDDEIIIKKLNQDIRKTSRYRIIAEGKFSDSYENPYYYSICMEDSDKFNKVETIHTMWDKHNIVCLTL